jgi:hypothetical protein
MNKYDADACIKAFSDLCNEVEADTLASTEDCQYWVFERGYKAAMEEILKVISVEQSEKSSPEDMAKKLKFATDARVALH